MKYSFMFRSEPEPQIMDYQTQQYKLFPAIATVFALNSSASWLWDVYNSVSSELEQGDLEKLPEVKYKKIVGILMAKRNLIFYFVSEATCYGVLFESSKYQGCF